MTFVGIDIRLDQGCLGEMTRLHRRRQIALIAILLYFTALFTVTHVQDYTR